MWHIGLNSQQRMGRRSDMSHGKARKRSGRWDKGASVGLWEGEKGLGMIMSGASRIIIISMFQR